MYQFYYAEGSGDSRRPVYRKSLADEFAVAAVRPAMWEEHCLECAAPECFGKCAHYAPRSDGRCRRFADGIRVSPDEKGVCGQAARVVFRKWANMMTIIYPSMLTPEAYARMTRRNRRLGVWLGRIIASGLPVRVRWETVRCVEYLRRRRLKQPDGTEAAPDAFVFHGYSFAEQRFRLIVEIFDRHTPVFKLALALEPGENLFIIGKEQLADVCSASGFLVKVYPENDLEAELDILWCDFVKGRRLTADKPAEKVKCVVWDLDNTVWDGTLIETDSPDSLRLKPHVMETVKALDERGVIQSVASKNDFDAAWRVVGRLGLAGYILCPQIHWNAKSGSLEQIAKHLNIGADSLALIDDSPFERNQVHSSLPQVRVYDPAGLETLLNRPEFDVPVTAESRNRRAMYQAEEKRREVMQSSGNGDTIAFLTRCHPRMEVFEPRTEGEKLRCYELLVRTNQLNLSGKKYTPEEYRAALDRAGHTNFAFSCEDDYGTYGIVGFGQYAVNGATLTFSEFAMSCRVAGKYAESALFSYLLVAEHCDKGVFAVKKTKKNVLLRNTLEGIGFRKIKDSDETAAYEFKSDLLYRELTAVTKKEKKSDEAAENEA